MGGRGSWRPAPPEHPSPGLLACEAVWEGIAHLHGTKRGSPKQACVSCPHQRASSRSRGSTPSRRWCLAFPGCALCAVLIGSDRGGHRRAAEAHERRKSRGRTCTVASRQNSASRGHGRTHSVSGKQTDAGTEEEDGGPPGSRTETQGVEG